MRDTRSHSASASSPYTAGVSTGPYSRLPSSNTRVGTPNPPCATTSSWSRLHVVVRRGVVDGLSTSPGSRPIDARISAATSGWCGLRPSTCSARARGLVEAVAVVHRRAPQQRRDAHHPPPVGPVALPRVLLALVAVDLLEREEPPVDLQAVLRRTSRIHSDVWYAHGHITSKWKRSVSVIEDNVPRAARGRCYRASSCRAAPTGNAIPPTPRASCSPPTIALLSIIVTRNHPRQREGGVVRSGAAVRPSARRVTTVIVGILQITALAAPLFAIVWVRRGRWTEIALALGTSVVAAARGRPPERLAQLAVPPEIILGADQPSWVTGSGVPLQRLSGRHRRRGHHHRAHPHHARGAAPRGGSSPPSPSPV